MSLHKSQKFYHISTRLTQLWKAGSDDELHGMYHSVDELLDSASYEGSICDDPSEKSATDAVTASSADAGAGADAGAQTESDVKQV